MFVYRIGQSKYIRDLSGVGAGLFGGRWNAKGNNMLYTAGTRSLACLEFLVHNYHILENENVALAKIYIEAEDSMIELFEDQLPHDWNENSYLPLSTQEVGTNFLLNRKKYVLKVPSAIVPGEFNFLLNSNHELHSYTKIDELIEPFKFDSRLFGNNGD